MPLLGTSAFNMLSVLDFTNGEFHGVSPPRDSTSFIRRCWFAERGCNESSKCANMRKMFEHAEFVKQLPGKKECKKPTYVATGSRYKHGFMEDNRTDTLEFSGEKWNKCCFTGGDVDGKNMKMVCEKIEVFPNSELVNKMDGLCGTKHCVGDRHRCFVVDKNVDKNFHSEKPLCPLGCRDKCTHITHKFECIDIGKEAGSFKEGNERPGEEGLYKVFSFAAPGPLSVLAMRPHRTRRDWCRCRNWKNFLN